MNSFSVEFKSERSSSVSNQLTKSNNYILTKLFPQRSSSYVSTSLQPLVNSLQIKNSRLTRASPLKSSITDKSIAYYSKVWGQVSGCCKIKRPMRRIRLPYRTLIPLALPVETAKQNSRMLSINAYYGHSPTLIRRSMNNCLISLKRKLNYLCPSLNRSSINNISTINADYQKQVIKVCVIPKVHCKAVKGI
jgi:hypothetical protein